MTTCTITFKRGDISGKEARKYFDNIAKGYVTVGIHSEEGSKQVGNNNFTMIKNACIQEFGDTQIVKKTRRFKSPITGKWFFIKKDTVINIPARPFIRIFNLNNIESKRLNNYIKNSIILKKPASLFWNQTGEYVRQVMKFRILDRKIKPDNSQMTKDYKGTNHPLMMTGNLAFAIKYKVH